MNCHHPSDQDSYKWPERDTLRATADALKLDEALKTDTWTLLFYRVFFKYGSENTKRMTSFFLPQNPVGKGELNL